LEPGPAGTRHRAQNPTGGGTVDAQTLRRRIADSLLDKIKEEQYPSVTMMNRVESVISNDREELSDYAEVLLEKVEESRFPSIDMLKRLDRLAAQLG
jgi:hypothetical protein